MVSMGRRWYLVAYDRDRQDWRSFRVDRISGAAHERPDLPPARAARRGRALLRPGRDPPDAAAVRRARGPRRRPDGRRGVRRALGSRLRRAGPGRPGDERRHPGLADVHAREHRRRLRRRVTAGAGRGGRRGRVRGSLGRCLSRELRSREYGLGHTEARDTAWGIRCRRCRGELMHGTLGSLDSLKGVPLHLALEYTGVGLVACDGSGMLTLISPTLQELFDMEYEPLSEPFYVERFHLFRADGETALPTDEVPLVRARRGEFVRDALVTTRRSDGTLVHLKCNAVPLRDDAGRRHRRDRAGPGRHGRDPGRAARGGAAEAAGRDDQPRVPYAARRAARARRADPRPPGPARRPRPGAGRLAGRHRALRLAAARPRPGGGGAGQPRAARGARRPAAAPDARGLTVTPRASCGSACRCRRRGAATPPAAAPTARVRLSVGIRATSAHIPVSTAMAAGPPSAASSAPPSTGASGMVDQLEELAHATAPGPRARAA